MAAITVLDPGLLATIQDQGRPGHGALGVAVSGAVDPLSWVVANRLVGNADGAAALELTLVGGAYRLETDSCVALVGAPMPLALEVAGAAPRALEPWAAHELRAGSVLRVGRAPWGVRAYLALAGGLAVAPLLGSAATHVASGWGGLGTGPLRRGDTLEQGSCAPGARPRALPQELRVALEGRLRAPLLRATVGSHTERFAAALRTAFWGATFLVTEQADRMGVRLSGPALEPPAAGMLTTEGLPLGAVEIPGAGEAIVLLADAPTTGGYPVIACVAAVDLPRLGQLRPRESIRFQQVELEEARAQYREEQRRWDEALPPQ